MNHGRRGYTLVEILVVMLLSFIVLGGVYRAVTRENIELDKEEIILDMQLNARAALDIIATDIRKAGFLGCAGNLAADTTSNSGTADPMRNLTVSGDTSTDLPIFDALKLAGGVNYIGAPLAYVNNAPGGHVTYQEGTDVISVRYLSGDRPLQAIMAAATDDPNVSANDFKQGDILYITDCEFYSIFQKTNSDSTLSIGHVTGALVPGNSSTNLGQAYGLNARVYNLVINTYFIQNNNSFAISQNDTPTDIVTNIEDLQFQYKWDANANNDLSDDNWSDDPFADPNVDASDIREIKVYVLAISEEVFSYTNNNLYDYPSSPYATTAPGDHRYRYLASAVVTLRNSGL
jgi:type IV pilus assembly protein PilW